MSVLLLGATGRLGREILKNLLKENIQTSILVRDKRKISIESEFLTVFVGNPANRAELELAMTGCDTIVTALNISRTSDFPWAKLRSPKDLLSSVMKDLVELGQNQQTKKIVTVSAWGVNESYSDIPFWFKWIINNSNIKYGYQDHERQEQVLKKSDLNWTIVRPVGLSNSQKYKQARVSLDSITHGLIISRKSVANFIVESLNSNDFDRKVATLS